jgi:hypothetical protein
MISMKWAHVILLATVFSTCLVSKKNVSAQWWDYSSELITLKARVKDVIGRFVFLPGRPSTYVMYPPRYGYGGNPYLKEDEIGVPFAYQRFPGRNPSAKSIGRYAFFGKLQPSPEPVTGSPAGK